MYSVIYDKILKLLQKNEELAKEYFYNVLTDENIYDKLTDQQIYDLFFNINFTNDNTLFKMSVLLNENFQNNINMYLERKIFIRIMNEHDHGEYLYSDIFVELLDKYSRRGGFIDDNIADVILRMHNFIDEDAIYYVLKSSGVGEISKEKFQQLIDAYEFYEHTMYKRALGILKSKEFVKRLTHRELKVFIERVSLNLDINESKRFVVEVLRLPSIKEKYLQHGQLYNFRYNSIEGIKSVNSLLMEKDYYRGLFKCQDRKKAYDLIEFFSKEDESFLEYFLYESLNDNSLELDKDLLYGLIKSDRQYSLIAMTMAKHGKLFVKCANYLNERYPNFGVDKLMKVLSTPKLIPPKLLEEVDEYNVSVVTNYLLHGLNLPIKSIYDYEWALMNYLDTAYKKPCNMSIFKDALCRNRYGMGFGEIHSLYKMYRGFVFKCDNEVLKREFREFEDIINGKDKEDLYKKYMTNIFTFDKANKYEMDIKEEYTREMKKCILSSDDLIVNNMIIYNGEAIPVVEVEDEFNLLISAVGFVHRLKVINDNYHDSIFYNENHLLHGLSTSLYSTNNMSRATGMFVLGYSDFYDYQVLYSSPTDIYSNSEQYRIFAHTPPSYVHPKLLEEYTRGDYNEIVIERNMIDKEDGLHISNIYPSYVLLDEDSDEAKYQAIKASRDLGIPIVYVNKNKIRERQKEEYKLALEKFDGSDIDEYVALINMAFRECYLTLDDDYQRDLSIIKEITDKLLLHNHSREDLLMIEEILVTEINKGASHVYDDVFKAIVNIRKNIDFNDKFNECEINEEYSKYIDEQLLNMIEEGYITQRFDGDRIKDARAYANACAYLYLKLRDKYGWYKTDVKDIITIALFISSNISEYKYDYYLNMGDENENFNNYYKLYCALKKNVAKISVGCRVYINKYFPTSASRALNTSGSYELIFNLGASLVEGESLDVIASNMGMSEKDLIKVRDEIISIYNNEIKIVENKRK